MQIWRSFDDVPADLGRTVVTIGNFDGVHLGHRHVLAQARATAGDLGVDTVVVVTFDPHPMAVLRPEHAPPILTSIETRGRLVEETGVDAVLVVPFDREIAGWSPEEFIDRVLVGTLHARAVVVGANFRFGHRAAGDVALLREAGATRDFDVEGIALDGGPQVWSSTYIRQCLATGDVAGAAEALGRSFTVRGVVVKGDQRGRELGYPTANVPTPVDGAAPADGVYAGWLTRRDTGERFPAAISVGTNPTFDGERERRVESYVLDRDDLELYGVEVEVEFVERLRGMVKFEGVEALVETMHDDVRRARTVLEQRS
ncbi:bifunctional riboflavin kinase/FAD synthetase [Nocardioides sp. Soil805]|uniref:bifunctional riboflavin kinase/FAD synthetase n=1 Tax=Nocardioides sp. Soil805 TaxID=1736416 RepID=UPI000702DB2D|nr:bifunctional riboflavin kinase/FAD synthetase [Nocardioides sp. Soil805]KRF36372.1 bifunctional riboflavin kinase/FMN adenylyltransferase [Nocardioides sp. Soil805]